jgi:hypothetical protein
LLASVTCFKAIGGADSLADSGAHILDALGDDRLSDIDMEPLDTSDLINNLTSLTSLTPLSLINSPVANIRTPVTIISNMSSSPRKSVSMMNMNSSPKKTLLSSNLTIRPSPGPEKLSFITIKNPAEKNKIFIS